MEKSEVWKPVLGWEKLYQVSNLGRVKTMPRVFRGKSCGVEHLGRRVTSERVLKPWINNNGYLIIDLVRFGYREKFLVHVLVAREFKPSKNKRYNQVDHINGIRTDNRAENLEFVTCSENHIRKNIRIKQRGVKK